MYPTTEIKRKICRAYAAECERHGSNSYDVLKYKALSLSSSDPELDRLHEIHWHAKHAALKAADGNKIHMMCALTDDGFPVLRV